MAFCFKLKAGSTSQESLKILGLNLQIQQFDFDPKPFRKYVAVFKIRIYQMVERWKIKLNIWIVLNQTVLVNHSLA